MSRKLIGSMAFFFFLQLVSLIRITEGTSEWSCSTSATPTLKVCLCTSPKPGAVADVVSFVPSACVLQVHADGTYFAVSKGDRIAQLVCEKIAYPTLEEAEVSVFCSMSVYFF